MKIIIVMDGGLIQNIVTDTAFKNEKGMPRIIVKDYDVEGEDNHPSIMPDRDGKLVAVAEWGLELWDETDADFVHFDKIRDLDAEIEVLEREIQVTGGLLDDRKHELLALQAQREGKA
jgi:hypothetical protein